MNLDLSLFLAFTAGIALGVFFSVNLWSSVKRMTRPETPWFVLYGDFMLRLSVVLGGFFLVMDGSWQRMVSVLLGFVLARQVMVRLIGRKPQIS